MSSEELSELHEHAEHAKHNPSLAPVSLTMAILAVLVAVVSLLGHRAATEAVLNQSKASDQWAYFQAKNIRGHEDKLFANLTAIIPASNGEALAKIREEYHAAFGEAHVLAVGVVDGNNWGDPGRNGIFGTLVRVVQTLIAWLPGLARIPA